ncbi:uncharacterized protein [Zea mays]|uniref:uncharacterized protein n=1 Tax=Zea mays TaxID=4577 RepID=UPI0004DEB3F5|nr:uncharacterized protein LOC103649395 [Zea mays]|eukprot:XP_008671897.1 uncharacterized protein LOC103649395 [Zea mays]
MLSSGRPSQAAAAFTEQQLKQFRAQCLVFLAVRNNMEPKKKHLEIALGEFSEEGGSSSRSGGGDDDDGDKTAGLYCSPVVVSSSAAAGLPPPDLLALSTLRLSSPRPRSGPTRRIVRRGPRRIQ